MSENETQRDKMKACALSIVATKGQGEDFEMQHMAAIDKATSEEKVKEQGMETGKTVWAEGEWELSVAVSEITFSHNPIVFEPVRIDIRVTR